MGLRRIGSIRGLEDGSGALEFNRDLITEDLPSTQECESDDHADRDPLSPYGEVVSEHLLAHFLLPLFRESSAFPKLDFLGSFLRSQIDALLAEKSGSNGHPATHALKLFNLLGTSHIRLRFLLFYYRLETDCG